MNRKFRRLSSVTRSRSVAVAAQTGLVRQAGNRPSLIALAVLSMLAQPVIAGEQQAPAMQETPAMWNWNATALGDIAALDSIQHNGDPTDHTQRMVAQPADEADTHGGTHRLDDGLRSTKEHAAVQRIGAPMAPKDDTNVVIGHGARAAHDKSVVVGANALVIFESGIATGYGATAEGAGAVAIGAMTKAGGESSVALGENSQTKAMFSVALGGKSIADEMETVSVGVKGERGMTRRIVNVTEARLDDKSNDAVTGRQLFATNKTMGEVKTTADAAGKASAAAAAKADAASASALALKGLVSEVSTAGNLRLGAANSGTVIDVANGKGAHRRISNVANAALSATSTEAVTGQQLFDSNRRLAEVEQRGVFLAIGQDGDREPAKAGLVAVALGDSAKASPTNEGGVALGAYAQALGKNAVALGRASQVRDSATDAFALGTRSRVEASGSMALGAGTIVEKDATNSAAIGQGSVALEANTVSVGHETMQRRIVNVASGTAPHDVVNVAQLNGTLVALGGGAHLDTNGNVIAPVYSVAGAAHTTLGDALGALDGTVTRTGTQVDTLERQLEKMFDPASVVRADGLHQLTLAGPNGMVLSNVANGLVAAGSRDAVNGGQLHAVKEQLNGRIDDLHGQMASDDRVLRTNDRVEPAAVSATEGGKEAAADSGNTMQPAGGDGQMRMQAGKRDDDTRPRQIPDQAQRDLLERANAYTDTAIQQVEQRLDKMDKRFNRMAAMNSAQSAMAMNTAGLATYNRLGAGVGYSEGESALAVGYQRVLNERGSATFSLSGAFTNSGERTVGVGLGVGW